MSEPVMVHLRKEDGEIEELCIGTLYSRYEGEPKVLVEMAIERLELDEDSWVYFEEDDPGCPAIPAMFVVGEGCYSVAAIEQPGCMEVHEYCFDDDDSPVALARFAKMYAAASRVVELTKQEQPIFFGYEDLERHQHYMSGSRNQWTATKPPPEPHRHPGRRKPK